MALEVTNMIPGKLGHGKFIQKQHYHRQARVYSTVSCYLNPIDFFSSNYCTANSCKWKIFHNPGFTTEIYKAGLSSDWMGPEVLNQVQTAV